MTVPFNLALVGPYTEHVSSSDLHTWGETMTSTVHSKTGGPGLGKPVRFGGVDHPWGV